MLTFKIYTDAGLTTEFTGNLALSNNVDGSSGDQDQVLYFGSVASGKTLQASSDPGVDPIMLSIADTTPDPGNGPEAVDVKLALTSVGLDSATGGAALNLGTAISSGVGNAIPIHIRRSPPTTGGVTGTFNELSLATVALEES